VEHPNPDSQILAGIEETSAHRPCVRV
jgi:hypothetical protein